MRCCLFCEKPLGLDADPRKRYCSKTCSDRKRAVAKRLVPWTVICHQCSTEFQTVRSHQRFCSKACQYEDAQIQANEKYRAFRLANPIPDSFDYTCDICKIVFTKSYRVSGIAIMRGVYCEDCRIIAEQARYRKKTVQRQSQVKPSGIWHEQLLERDGAGCYLCGDVIDMSVARTSKRGATVDHVVPLSRGGSDELENLRLAHWECNVRKSNKLVEEL